MQFLVTLILVGCVYSRTTEHDYSSEYQYDNYEDAPETDEVAIEVDAKMITQSKNIEVNQGEEVHLPCVIDSRDKLERLWSRTDPYTIISMPGDQVIEVHKKDFRIQDGELIIDSASSKHSGTYNCKIAVNEKIQVSHHLRVNNISTAQGTEKRILDSNSSHSLKWSLGSLILSLAFQFL